MKNNNKKAVNSLRFQENNTTDHFDLIEGFALFAINAERKQQAAIR
jgi:hypothetical protein